ncbi:hypothetical protein LCGC14_0980960 [marine sediment metagenome]|uniref:Uncharacterized protein n=1 Tax=marine sediment metagenome TaxID=412755 RepID=A0A0F9RFC0_9ZZZZ
MPCWKVDERPKCKNCNGEERYCNLHKRPIGRRPFSCIHYKPEYKLVLNIIQNQYSGSASWTVDEEDSTVRLPEYDGSDNQRVELIVTDVKRIDW